GKTPYLALKLLMLIVNCLRSLVVCNWGPLDTSGITATNTNADRMPMIEITTSSSTSVKPDRARGPIRRMGFLREDLLLRAAQPFQQSQQRHEQSDDDGADDEAQDDDHDWFEQADEG